MQSAKTTAASFDSQVDPQQLKRLRLRIDVDDGLYAGLRKLKIRGRELNDLPAGIFDLTELEVLDLSPERESCIYYRLPEVPREIARLRGLRVLMLDTNDLDRIPAEVCLLVGLEKLSLSNNCLREVPESIGSLARIRSLHLSNNRLTRLPRSIVELDALTFLDLGSNYLESLPEDISRMNSLESLVVVSIDGIASIACIWAYLHTCRPTVRELQRIMYM